MLQCFAVVWQDLAECCIVMQCAASVAACCSVLQCVVLQFFAVCCSDSHFAAATGATWSHCARTLGISEAQTCGRITSRIHLFFFWLDYRVEFKKKKMENRVPWV